MVRRRLLGRRIQIRRMFLDEIGIDEKKFLGEGGYNDRHVE